MSAIVQSSHRRSENFATAEGAPRIAIIIPACNEAACIGAVLEELLASVSATKYVVAVGVNNSSDRTAGIARQFPVVLAETTERGYGYGCAAAIAAVTEAYPTVEAYVFFAGDGASDPQDLLALAAAYDQGYAMVLGARTMRRSNWRAMSLPHVLANVSLGCWCGMLTGRWFRDLAPLRLIDRSLFAALDPREMTFGWTIEAQVGAALGGASICEVPARERARLAGEQKVSGVTWRQTFSIGCRILAAGWRARRRYGERLCLGHRSTQQAVRAAATASIGE
ncbi:MAG: glycosyltransferase [Verrucomicrobiota bacterium]|nr:glycosyltransferase [Verrucomicrobiota bacterium]